ncbi:copia protein [Tanacetum coccineum]
MARTKSGRMITKDIENMTIAEYMEYEAEIKRDPWGYAQSYTRSSGSTTLERSKENKHHPDKLKTNAYFPSFPPCFKPAQPLTKDTHEPVEKDPNDVNLYAPNSHHKDEEVSSEEVVDEWLNAKMSKRMIGQDKEEDKDALIDILKIVGISFVTEEEKDDSSETLPCQLPPNEMNPGSFTLSCTIVEMADMTKKAPLGIVENILVKIDKFLFHSDFVVIDMLEGLNETMLLGRPFLVTIHAQIDVFRRDILLGIGEEKVKFYMNGGICHSRVPVEIFYMESSVKESENFNLLKLKMMYSLMIPLRACYWSKVPLPVARKA